MNKSLTNKLTEFTYFRGRVALYAILKELGVGTGNHVALQAFTCLAVPEAIMATGAIPVYVDIEPNGVNMNPDDLNHKITPQTRAIVVQHTYGVPANIHPILELGNKHSIPIVEDCCHTLTSRINSRQVGSFGVASFYSFEWGKPVVIGIGGSALVNDIDLRERLKNNYSRFKQPGIHEQLKLLAQYYAYRTFYRPSSYWPLRAVFQKLSSVGLVRGNYNSVFRRGKAIDFSFRMPKGISIRLHKQLRYIDKIEKHIRWVANQYLSHINSGLVRHLSLPGSCDVVFARYPLLTDFKLALLEKAHKAKMELAGWYSTPVHPLSEQELNWVCYKKGSCPEAEKRCKEIITLPTNQYVRDRDIDKTIHFFKTVRI